MNPSAEQILNGVFQYGQSSTSFLTTYPGLKHFKYQEGSETVRIAYVDTQTAWVGASDPIGKEELWLASVLEFFAAAKAERKIAFLLPVSKKLVIQARERNLHAFQIGQEPWFQLKLFQEPKISKHLRARGAEVSVFNPAHISAKERLELESITEDWLESRKAAPLDFLNQVRPWLHMQHKRYFRVILNGHALGYLSAIPIPEMNAWYLIDLIRAPNAPLGTTELLISEAVNSLAKEGATGMTLGMAPLAKVDESERNRHPKLYSFFDFLFEKTSFFYNFKTLFQFKEKMKPTSWRPLYLLSSEDGFGVKASYGLFRAIFPGSISKTIGITSVKLAKRATQVPSFDRLLSLRYVTRSKPRSWLELTVRMKVTLTILITNVLFFFASTTHELKLRAGTSQRLTFNIERFANGIDSDDFRALILHSFLHWNLFHLVFNMVILVALVGYLEVIAGSTLVLVTYLAGILLSNPLTSLILETLIRWIHPSLLHQFNHENDVGCSLGVFAGIAALAHFMDHPEFLLGGFAIGTVIVSLANSSILGLNHLVALAIGYGIGKYYAQKTEK